MNEILELERQAARPRILSLRKPNDGMFHDSVCRVQARAEYLPESLAEMASKLGPALGRAWRGGARRVLSAAGEALARRSVRLVEVSQALLALRWAEKHKVAHFHVHFGTDEATVAWLCRRLGGPTYSLTLHAFDIFRDNVDRRLLADKVNASQFTVTVCESNARYLRERVPGLRAERVRVLHNGIDVDRFEPADAARRDPRLVIGVGRLIEKKGFAHLVRALARLRDRGRPLRCEIIGDGPEDRPLREEIRRLELDPFVRLLGPLRQDEVRRKMQSAACLALPCVQARDGNVDALPTVLLEAMACACPVISTRLSGVPEIIEDGESGLLVEPGDDESLADAIDRVATDRPAAARLGQAGRARVEERFDIRRNVRVLHDWLLHPASGGAAASVTEPVRAVGDILPTSMPEIEPAGGARCA